MERATGEAVVHQELSRMAGAVEQDHSPSLPLAATGETKVSVLEYRRTTREIEGKPIGEKQSGKDEKVRELLCDADLKKFDEELFKATQARKTSRLVVAEPERRTLPR